MAKYQSFITTTQLLLQELQLLLLSWLNYRREASFSLSLSCSLFLCDTELQRIVILAWERERQLFRGEYANKMEIEKQTNKTGGYGVCVIV